MSSNRDRDQRIFIAVGVVVAFLLLLSVFFVFMLAVAMRVDPVISLTNSAMVLGFAAWLYLAYRRVKQAETKKGQNESGAAMFIGAIELSLFVISGVGLVFAGAQTAALWSNVFIAFYMLVTYTLAGIQVVKVQINLYKLK